jgi:hypothetical protein
MDMGADMDMEMNTAMNTDTDFSFRFKPIPNQTRSVLVFSEKQKKSVCFGVSEPFRKEPKQKMGVLEQPKLKINTLFVMDMGVNMDMDMTIFHMFRFVSKSLWVF